MAQQRLGSLLGVSANNANSGAQRSNLNGSTGVSTEFGGVNFNDIGSMRTRLAAIDAGYYTAARLNSMTYNDMVYAIRRNDFPTSLKA